MGSLKHTINTHKMSVKPIKQHKRKHQDKYTLKTLPEHKYGYLGIATHAQYTNARQNAV
jgi:hypothetical protein